MSSASRRLAASPTYVYRCYDADARLIYVGLTVNPEQRLIGHSYSQLHGWWPRVYSYTLELHPNREEAAFAEKVAMMLERPACNVIGNVVRVRTYASGGWWFQQLAAEEREFGIAERDSGRYRTLCLLAAEKWWEGLRLRDDPEMKDEFNWALEWVEYFAEEAGKISPLSVGEFLDLLEGRLSM